MPRWEKGAYFGLVVVSIMVGVAELYLFRTYMVDDAFISLRYVRNALAGHGLVYNLGDRVEGFTSPLFILLNYILGRIGIDLILASKILGVASYALILAIVFAWSFLGRRPWEIDAPAASMVFTIIATSFPLTFFAITGMETVLFSFLTLLVFLEALKSRITPKLISLIYLAFLCRPEGIMFLFWITVGIVLVRYANPDNQFDNSRNLLFLENREFLCIGVFMLAVLVFLSVRWQYYGEILPNTFFAKAPWTMESPGVYWTFKGIGSISYFFSAAGGVLGILIFFSAFFQKTSSYRALMMCVMIVLAIMIFQKYAGSDWMIGARYFIPALPVWALGVGISINSLKILQNIKIPYYRVAVVCLVTIGFWTMNVSETSEFLKNKNKYPNSVQTSIGLKKIGMWIHDNLPANYRIRNWRIGAIGYYCENPILDTWGLVNREIGRLRFYSSSEKEGSRQALAFVNKMEPEAIITKLKSGRASSEDGYCLFYKGKNGDQTLGVWVRKDLAPELIIKPLEPCKN